MRLLLPFFRAMRMRLECRKGQPGRALMTEIEKIELLNKLADRLFCPTEPTYAGKELPPFDIKRANVHNNKKEFLEELHLVRAMSDHFHGIQTLLMISPDDPDPLREATIRRVQVAQDISVRQGLRKRKLRGATANDLVIQNFRDTGFSANFVSVISDAAFACKHRLEELEDQERHFWSSPNRPPNHFARTIALRFAKLFARQTGKQPTYGTSSAGGHPSTDFGRALEEVFAILGVRANLRGAAEWAVKQLTEEDWNPKAQAWPPMGILPYHSNLATNEILAAMINKDP